MLPDVSEEHIASIFRVEYMLNYQFVSSSQDVLLHMNILQLQADTLGRKQMSRCTTKSATSNFVKVEIPLSIKFRD
jgi:hypothetical protein